MSVLPKAWDGHRPGQVRKAHDHKMLQSEVLKANTSWAELYLKIRREIDDAGIAAAAAGGDFSDGGDTAGANRTLGNNDSYTLALETNNTVALTIDTAQDVEIANTMTLPMTDSVTTGVIYKYDQNPIRRSFIHTFRHPTALSGTIIGDNTFVGDRAGNFTMGATATVNTQASDNVGVGRGALNSLTTGNGNMAVGSFSLGLMTSGSRNVGVGYQTCYNTTTGNDNMGIGFLSCSTVTTGSGNVGVGGYACRGMSSGYSNVGIGDHALYGEKNLCVAIGQSALNAVGGNNTTALGAYAGTASTSASCVYLGYKAGWKHTSEGSRLVVDTMGQANAADEITNSMLYGAFNATVASQTLRLNGLVGVNATPAATLDVVGISDVVQLSVKAHSTQTANIAEWYNEAGDLAVQITGDGYLCPTLGFSTNEIYVGYQCGDPAASGSQNTGLGSYAMRNITSGGKNTAVGNSALIGISEGAYNSALGLSSLEAVTTGDYNVGVGSSAGVNITTGYQNMCIGSQAGGGNQTGTNNVAIGYQALKGVAGNNYTGNVAIGTLAGKSITTGGSNMLIGNGAGQALTTSNNNVIIGASAGYDLTGDGNMLFGSLTGTDLTTGRLNVMIGYQAGFVATTSDTCIFIGNEAGGKHTTSNNKFKVHNNSLANEGLEETAGFMYGEMSSTVADQLLRVNGRLSCNATALAMCHIDQPVTDEAIPVLYLDQADVSEEMIEFNTTIGTGNAIEAIGAKTLTTTHFIKVTIPGALTRYIPCGTIA